MDTRTGYPAQTRNANEMNAAAGADQSAQIEAQAMDDALWRMMQNNAVAKIRGYNTMAKAINDMA